MKNFTFNKEEHYYELDGKRMYGITTILGVIAKPALIQWAANMAVEYVMNIAEQDGKGNYTCNDEVLKEAAIQPIAAPAKTEEKPKEAKKDEKKDEAQAAAGLGALFG